MYRRLVECATTINLHSQNEPKALDKRKVWTNKQNRTKKIKQNKNKTTKNLLTITVTKNYDTSPADVITIKMHSVSVAGLVRYDSISAFGPDGCGGKVDMDDVCTERSRTLVKQSSVSTL